MDSQSALPAEEDHIPTNEWEVLDIVGKEVIDNEVFYMIAWKPTLEHVDNLGNMKELIQDWEQRQARRRRNKTAPKQGIKKRGRPRKQK
ncbi:hypothetical protein VM1G_12089 [Cytospora mali]|nr:hypothetical protein VM1G_12089 [Valsa mali]